MQSTAAPLTVIQQTIDKIGQQMYNLTKDDKKKTQDLMPKTQIELMNMSVDIPTFKKILDWMKKNENMLITLVPKMPSSDMDERTYNQARNVRENEIDRLNQRMIPDMQAEFIDLIDKAIYMQTITLDQAEFLKQQFDKVILPFVTSRNSELELQPGNKLRKLEKYAKDLISNIRAIKKVYGKSEFMDQTEAELNDLLRHIQTIKRNIDKNPNQIVHYGDIKQELDDIRDLLEREEMTSPSTRQQSNLLKGDKIDDAIMKLNVRYSEVANDLSNMLVEHPEIIDEFNEITKQKEKFIRYSKRNPIVNFEDQQRFSDIIKDLELRLVDMKIEISMKDVIDRKAMMINNPKLTESRPPKYEGKKYKQLFAAIEEEQEIVDTNIDDIEQLQNILIQTRDSGIDQREIDIMQQMYDDLEALREPLKINDQKLSTIYTDLTKKPAKTSTEIEERILYGVNMKNIEITNRIKAIQVDYEKVQQQINERKKAVARENKAREDERKAFEDKKKAEYELKLRMNPEPLESVRGLFGSGMSKKKQQSSNKNKLIIKF